MERKSKGISEIMPSEIVFQGILDYVELGTVDRIKILEEVKQYTNGQRRAEKIRNHIAASLENKTNVLEVLKKDNALTFLINMSDREKNLLVISIIAMRYPIIYDALSCLGKLFKLQDTINIQVITDSLAEIYGANSTFHHTVYGVIETLVSAGLITRVKTGLYAKTENELVNNLITECWYYAYYFINDRKPFAVDDVSYLSWFQFITTDDIQWSSCKILKTRTENSGKIWVE